MCSGTPIENSWVGQFIVQCYACLSRRQLHCVQWGFLPRNCAQDCSLHRLFRLLFVFIDRKSEQILPPTPYIKIHVKAIGWCIKRVCLMRILCLVFLPLASPMMYSLESWKLFLLLLPITPSCPISGKHLGIQRTE